MRQWPQMGEIVRTRQLIADIEGNFPELTLEVGRRLQLDEVLVVEWTCDYGDGRLYRNVTIGELEDGRAVRSDWGEPTSTPEWRRSLTERLEMPGDGTVARRGPPRSPLAVTRSSREGGAAGTVRA